MCDIDDLPARITELQRLIKIRAGDKGAGAMYSCTAVTRHRILCWINGQPDAEFAGETFGEVYRPAHEFCRAAPPEVLGAAEYDSWIDPIDAMIGDWQGVPAGFVGMASDPQRVMAFPYLTQTIEETSSTPAPTPEQRRDLESAAASLSRAAEGRIGPATDCGISRAVDCLRKAGRHALALRLANTEEQRAVDGVLAAIHEELAR